MGSGSSCFPYQLKTCGHHEASPLIPCPQVCSPGECSTPKCPNTCSEAGYPTAWAKDKTKSSKGAYRLSSVAAAQTDIMTYGSISAAFTVYEDFLTYTSGVYTHQSGAELGGHAVKSAFCSAALPQLRSEPPPPNHPLTAPFIANSLRVGHLARRRGLLARCQQLEQLLCVRARRGVGGHSCENSCPF